MSNLYYRYTPGDPANGAIPAATAKQQPDAASALPYAGPHGGGTHGPPGSDGAAAAAAAWDATASGQLQRPTFAQPQHHQMHGQSRSSGLNGRTLSAGLPTSATGVDSATGQAGQNHDVHLLDPFSQSATHPAAAAAAAAATAAASASSAGGDTVPMSAHHHLRAASASANGVFDPNDFPSLGGSVPSSNGPMNAGAPSSFLSGLDPPQPVSVAATSAPNALSDVPHPLSSSDYADLYSMNALGAGRKAVDALTSAGGASEFFIQSEDFPALGALGAKQSMFASHQLSGNHEHALQHHGPAHQRQQQQLLHQHHRTPKLSQLHPPQQPGDFQQRQQQLHLQQQQQMQQTKHVLVAGQQQGQQLSPAGYSSLGAFCTPNGNLPGVTAVPSQPSTSRGPANIQSVAELPNGTQSTGFPVSSHTVGTKQLQPQSHTQEQQLGQTPFPPATQSSQIISGGRSSRPGRSLLDMSAATVSNPLSTNPEGPASLRSAYQTTSHVPSSRGLGGLSDDASEKDVSGAELSGGSLAQPNQRSGAEVGVTTDTASASSASQAVAVESNTVSTGQPAQEEGNQGPGSVVDEHGMKGLLRVLKSGADKTDLFLLTIGLDLTMLGLNLNSPDPLYQTFESPWDEDQTTAGAGVNGASGGARSGESDYKLPECYYMQPPALKKSHFTKFQLETLFYVFYNMPGDVLQLLAAIELSNREWRYHKDLKLWFTRAPGTAPGFERGAYIYFDISHWERRPFHDANHKFIQGLMTEDELRSARITSQTSGVLST